VWGAVDTAVLSSRREGLPQVIVESLRAGVPVVAHGVGGVPELVRHDVDGRVVDPLDPADLTRALLAVAGDPALRERWSRAARDRVLDEHLPAAVAERLAQLYATLTGPVLEKTRTPGQTAPSCTSSS
jgi:glycosyltransferase involved in cell wall biosynthesis